MTMVYRRLKEILGIAMIGEGVVVLLRPRRYSRFWDCGPQWLRAMARGFAQHPETTRAVGFIELMAGIFLALRQIDKSVGKS